jgi:hypothetical protein
MIRAEVRSMNEKGFVSGAAAMLLAATCLAADAPEVPVPATPGAAGSVIANGKTITIQHVYARAVPDPSFPGRDRAMLFLSDRPLVLSDAAWAGGASDVDFEGLLLSVSENGRVSFLRVRQGTLDYGSQGQKMDRFEWADGVVKGQETDYGDHEGQRISYGIAFNTPIAKTAAKPPAKRR